MHTPEHPPSKAHHWAAAADDNLRRSRLLQRGSVAIVAAVVVVSLVTTVAGIDAAELRSAETIASTVTAETVALRGFVARIGGVYAEPGEGLEPNPYLHHAQRDVKTPDGRDLTLLNPAYMTRLMSQELTRRNGIEVRMLSMTPRNPANVAPADIARILATLEPGGEGVGQRVFADGRDSYRFVAPVAIEARCSSCHPEWRGKVGELAGGIAVTFAWEPFAAAGRVQKATAAGVHLLVLLTVVALLWRLGRALTDRAQELSVAGRRIESLEGLLKICSVCSRVRRRDEAPADPKSWVRVEAYISSATDADWSHGLCPDCYGDMTHPGHNRRASDRRGPA